MVKKRLRVWYWLLVKISEIKPGIKLSDTQVKPLKNLLVTSTRHVKSLFSQKAFLKFSLAFNIVQKKSFDKNEKIIYILHSHFSTFF